MRVCILSQRPENDTSESAASTFTVTAIHDVTKMAQVSPPDSGVRPGFGIIQLTVLRLHWIESPA
jgi:hypothetical protein